MVEVIGCELSGMARNEVESRFVEDEGVVAANKICGDLRCVDILYMNTGRARTDGRET